MIDIGLFSLKIRVQHCNVKRKVITWRRVVKSVYCATGGPDFASRWEFRMIVMLLATIARAAIGG